MYEDVMWQTWGLLGCVQGGDTGTMLIHYLRALLHCCIHVVVVLCWYID